MDSPLRRRNFLVSLALALALQPVVAPDPGRIAVHRRGPAPWIPTAWIWRSQALIPCRQAAAMNRVGARLCPVDLPPAFIQRGFNRKILGGIMPPRFFVLILRGLELKFSYLITHDCSHHELY